MIGKLLICGEKPETVRLLGELLVRWDMAGGWEIVVAGGRDELLHEVRRGLGQADGIVVAPGDWSYLDAVAEASESPRIVVVGLDDAEIAASGASAVSGLPVVRGRGLDGFRWAAAWLTQRLEYPFEEISYGEHPDQIADLRMPPEASTPVPAAVFLHGGFWRERWVRDTIEPAAIDLARQGIATLNVEYRRVRAGFGGWRETADDVAAAIDYLSVRGQELDLSRVVFIGHSAGAQLAVWAVKRRGSSHGIARVYPRAVVLLAGMADLRETARRGLGDTGNPTTAFMGGDDMECQDDYDCASPAANLPLGVAQIVVQGARDSPDLLDIARTYAEMAQTSGDRARYLEIDDGDHFTVITPSRPEWGATVGAIRDVLDD